MNPRYALVALRAAHRCEYCHAPEAIFNLPFEVEHIIPLAQGGVDTAANWALACRACNLRKAAHLRGVDPESQIAVQLFNPRADRWVEHFRADLETGEIIGLSPCGRATVARMAMNSESQKVARRQWILLGLFP